MNSKADYKSTALPADLADVALIDAQACAATGDMSISWWLAEVAAGRAPPPAIRKPRCTRWRIAEVRRFWIESAERAAADTHAIERVKAHATKASNAAQAKRAAAAS